MADVSDFQPYLAMKYEQPSQLILGGGGGDMGGGMPYGGDGEFIGLIYSPTFPELFDCHKKDGWNFHLKLC